MGIELGSITLTRAAVFVAPSISAASSSSLGNSSNVILSSQVVNGIVKNQI